MKSRSQALEIVALREFDMVVIGGGIVGAGIAQNAASRGLSVLVVEKEDFASGTSSKTTKLIHGGLRYLEQLHLHLTRELCQERALLETLAPHMVRDFSFILPLTKRDPLFGLKAQLGLTLYDLLAWSVTNNHHHQRIDQRELLEAAPSLSANVVTGGLRFHDCITDDSRLVIEVLKSAVAEGAHVVNYLEVTGFQAENNLVTAVECHDRYSGKEIIIKCKSCVNAAGVWSDKLLKKLDDTWRPTVSPAKGVHIMVPPSAFETNTALFLPTSDHRYVFVVPWNRSLMIGTTDTGYDGDIDNPLPVQDEIDYLLDVVNRYSEPNKLNRSDVTASWAGLRPLVGGATTDPKQTGNLSREHLIFEGPGGIVGLIGGKLTNYRLMAVQVVDKVLAKIPIGTGKAANTRRMMLGGWLDKNDFLAQTASIASKARRLSVEPSTLDHLIASYGRDANLIIDIIEQQPSLNQRVCPDFPNVMAEIPYCITNEMAVSLEDLLFRRMRLAMLHQKQTLEAAPKVAKLMQETLGWDDARTNLELVSLEKSLNEHLTSFATVRS
ncbi:glycerol-3-phosphate dehydrogenase/oxidase [soil metagenome]